MSLFAGMGKIILEQLRYLRAEPDVAPAPGARPTALAIEEDPDDSSGWEAPSLSDTGPPSTRYLH